MSRHQKTKIRNADIARHLDVLCRQIGNRYSGTKGEKLAAEYIAGKMSEFGLETIIQPFKFLNWIPQRIKATLIRRRKETRIPNAGPFLYSPSTKRAGVEGDIVYIESNLPAFFRKREIRGKIGLNIGAFEIADPEIARRIKESGLKGMMTVDDRIPFPWRIPIGQAPQWRDDYSLPTVSIPYMKAIDLVKVLPAKARLEIDARSGVAESWNVIGDIRGSKYPDDIIVVCAHTDSVLYNAGADDNASGCAFVLELARQMVRLKPARTVRFICYGVEEKLSVGAYTYMRSIEKTDAKRIVFCLNVDSIGGRIGQNTALCTGSPELRGYIQRQFDMLDYSGEVRDEVNPYSDHFPLNICGVPSVWMTRLNLFKASYWALHSVHDNLENISLDVCRDTLSVWREILLDLTSQAKKPFPRKISRKLMDDVRRVARVSYRHPWNPRL